MKKNNKKGFTLVELVIVVAVMAVLVAVAIPTIGSIKGSAETSVAKSNAKTIESIIKLADANGAGTGVVGADAIAKAIFDAKLGITSETTVNTYYYSPTTGAVYTDSSDAEDAWTIEFDNYEPEDTDTYGDTIDGVKVTPTELDGEEYVPVEEGEESYFPAIAGE